MKMSQARNDSHDDELKHLISFQVLLVHTPYRSTELVYVEYEYKTVLFLFVKYFSEMGTIWYRL